MAHDVCVGMCYVFVRWFHLVLSSIVVFVYLIRSCDVITAACVVSRCVCDASCVLSVRVLVVPIVLLRCWCSCDGMGMFCV